MCSVSLFYDNFESFLIDTIWILSFSFVFFLSYLHPTNQSSILYNYYCLPSHNLHCFFLINSMLGIN